MPAPGWGRPGSPGSLHGDAVRGKRPEVGRRVGGNSVIRLLPPTARTRTSERAAGPAAPSSGCGSFTPLVEITCHVIGGCAHPPGPPRWCPCRLPGWRRARAGSEGRPVGLSLGHGGRAGPVMLPDPGRKQEPVCSPEAAGLGPAGRPGLTPREWVSLSPWRAGAGPRAARTGFCCLRESVTPCPALPRGPGVPGERFLLYFVLFSNMIPAGQALPRPGWSCDRDRDQGSPATLRLMIPPPSK